MVGRSVATIWLAGMAAAFAAGPLPAQPPPRAAPSAGSDARPAADAITGSLLAQAGARTTRGACDPACRIDVTFEQAKLLGTIPRLQDLGLLSPALTADEIDKRPFFFTQAVAVLLASRDVRRTYEREPALDRTAWRIGLDTKRKDGRGGGDEIFSFGFDRDRYRRIDWERMAFVQFPTAARGFSTNLWLTMRTSREVDGGIHDD